MDYMLNFGLLLLVVHCLEVGTIPTERPIVVAHRGSSGRYPEMTPISFDSAITEGADMLECDLCITRDLQIVCAHESWMEDYTNVAGIFDSSRRNTYFVDDQGRLITDYFTVDFTMDELKQIGKRQRYDYRDPNFDDLFPMASLEECIQLAQNANRTISLLPEIKDPIWVNSLDFVQEANTTIEELLVQLFAVYGYTDIESPVVIQSFNEDIIKGLRSITDLDLAFLVRNDGEVTDEKLTEYAQYGSSIGASKGLIVRISDDEIIGTTDLVERAHAAGLKVNAWTLRNEDRYLAWDYGQDPWNEYKEFLNLNVDGFITDFPETAKNFLDSIYNCNNTIA